MMVTGKETYTVYASSPTSMQFHLSHVTSRHLLFVLFLCVSIFSLLIPADALFCYYISHHSHTHIYTLYNIYNHLLGFSFHKLLWPFLSCYLPFTLFIPSIHFSRNIKKIRHRGLYWIPSNDIYTERYVYVGAQCNCFAFKSRISYIEWGEEKCRSEKSKRPRVKEARRHSTNRRVGRQLNHVRRVMPYRVQEERRQNKIERERM